jgi:nucleotide-binding universal stress UspA family protein
METPKNNVLVPYDFTEIADYAVAHAAKYARLLNAGITLLHVVKKETQVDDQLERLKVVADAIEKEHFIKPDFLIKEGTIFKTITQVAEEINAVLVAMGTHGMKGLQKLTGSWALKVIVGSRIPFIVVQDAPAVNETSKIVFPVDFKIENKEKLKWVEFVSKYFNTNIHILSIASKEGTVDSRTKANVVFSKKFLDEKGIKYELAIADGGGSYAQETINYAKKINADLIIVMTTRDIAFHDYVLGASEQYIIANDAKIPVLVVNPRTDLMKYGYGGFG